MLTGTRAGHIYLTTGAAALIALFLAGCHKAIAPDEVCSYESLPKEAQVPAGQGGIQVVASTDTYFAVRATGKQIASGHVNAIVPAPVGDYEVVLNNSTHATSAKSKMLTKCTGAAVMVSGTTDEYYAVLDQAAHQLSSAHLASALSLFPGPYTLRVNNSDAAVNLKPGTMLEVKPGTVNMDVGTDEYYVVLDAAARQLASSHVGRALGLFPGSYTLRINNSDVHADVRAGEATTVVAGTLVVHGTTDEYYAIMNNGGLQLASAHLEKPLAFIPGTYKVKVNNTVAAATVASGTTSEIQTGAVVVQGTTDDYYAIFDSAGTQLASTHLGRTLSFLPGTYRAKLNNSTLTVQVEPGRTGEYQSGSLMVKSGGSDYYAVLDPAGTQLASKQVNQPVSLAAGKYSIKVGNNTRTATVTAGQNVVVNW